MEEDAHQSKQPQGEATREQLITYVKKKTKAIKDLEAANAELKVQC